MSSSKTFVAAPGADATRTPVRLVVVEGDERPAVDVTDEPMVMTMPHLIVRELIAFLALSLGLIILSLTVDAPLEEIANATRTPNPAKAPWYFLGLQELLHYYPPLVSGVILPGLLVVALVVVPYMRVNLQRVSLAVHHPVRVLVVLWSAILVLGILSYTTGAQPVWPFIGTLLAVGCAITLGVGTHSRRRPLVWLRSRSIAFWIFSWFLLTAAVLTIIGVFFRGPGWAFTLPWRDGVFY
jgi:menaquinol-cytochrome c reductase cytochrome b/c subunit